ncbi:MAG: lolD [Phycisphaerales bacterium]|nr:lolD [Phycisphaerales bacterium]
MPTADLIVSELRKEYPTPTQPLVVLRGVNLLLSPGERLAVVGPSGSGKSTLLNILGTLDSPSGGSVHLGGVNPFSLLGKELARFRSRTIGFIFQDHHLLPQCTALENVLLPRLALGKTTEEDRRRSVELLGQVGLAERVTHLPAELSGGERQRVAIARALINRPALLLCDEPTGNLDAKTADTVADLLLSLSRETILIGVTHSAHLAERFGRRMQMADGELVDG